MRLEEIAQQPAFDKQAILAELAKLKIKSKIKINADGSVDVQGDVSIPREYTKIPVQFRNVSGKFSCHNTQITSLQGAPQQVGGNFWCTNTKITSLQGAPHQVGGCFGCEQTSITSLQHAPQQVGGNFYCNDTKIISLQHAPQFVGKEVYCYGTEIKSLHNIHKIHIDWVIGYALSLPDKCTHLLGLAYIPGVKRIHLGSSNAIDVIHDVFEWQEKLLELGLTEQAQL
jgi:hypothetical protein